MDLVRGVVWATVVVIVGTSVASGPLVSSVTLTQQETDLSPETVGTGSVDLTVDHLPESASLDAEGHGSSNYVIRVPDAHVTIDSVTGQPMLVYELELPDLGKTLSSTHFLDDGMEGPLSLSIDYSKVDAESVTENEYEARLQIGVRTDDTVEIIVERTVTVDVSE